jgi:hypothetical protein
VIIAMVSEFGLTVMRKLHCRARHHPELVLPPQGHHSQGSVIPAGTRPAPGGGRFGGSRLQGHPGLPRPYGPVSTPLALIPSS